MKMSLAFFLFATLFSGLAHADELAQLCALHVRHEPDADVLHDPHKTEYDRQGRPIAGADLYGSSSIKMAEDFRIPITLDLGEKLGLGLDESLLEAKIFIGTVSYYNRQFFFNGEPFNPEQQDALNQLCQNHRE